VKQKTLVCAIRRTLSAELLLSAAFISSAYAQSAPTTGAAAPVPASSAASGHVTQLQKVEVTGSLIKSSDKVGFNQVQTITAKDIQNSGATTVTDFLRDVSANSANSVAENTPVNFAPGGAGIALRGLSEKYTLVLVDGQRVAPYALATNDTDSFFDINSIPLNMVDRIEIVKTGAVSQYGSDAIAGVVNIITKKNFQGIQLDGSLGGLTGGGNGTTQFGVTAGFGDLNADRFNVTIGASLFHQDGFMQSDRSNTSGEDYTNQPYGLLTKAPDFWEPNGLGNGSWKGNCPNGGSLVPGSTVIGGPSSGVACAINTANGMTALPDETRVNGKIHATFQLTDNVQAYADLWESRNTTNLDEGYTGIGDGTPAFDPATGGLSPVSNIVSGNNPYNPNGADTPINYTFMGQPMAVKTTSNFYRAATGLKGTFSTPSFGDWDWSAAVSHSQSTVDNYETGLLSVDGLKNILGPNGQFDFSNPSATPNGLDGLYTTDENEAISKLETVDLTASTANLFSLPAGDVGFGVGAQFMHESEYISPMAGAASGQSIPFSLQSVDGERNVAAAYYQIDVPLLRGLSFSHSGRYDHYNDFGGAYSPRFALRWQPVPMLTAYASYDRGFRAPTLIETSQTTGYAFQDFVDPYNPVNPGQSTAIPEKIHGNPNLQPERTKNYNLGFELSPNANTEIGIDWYKIVISNVIGTADVQSEIDDPNSPAVHRNSNGSIAYVDSTYENLNSMRTDGFELTFRKAQPTDYGIFTLSGDFAYVWHFDVDDGGDTINCAGNDGCITQPFGASFPRWKGNLTLDWNYRKFDTALTYQYTGPFTSTQQPVVPGSVASYSQFNLVATYTGFKHWTIYAGINNLFDRTPPFDPLMQYWYQIPYDPSLNDNEGRYAEVGATYRF